MDESLSSKRHQDSTSRPSIIDYVIKNLAHQIPSDVNMRDSSSRPANDISLDQKEESKDYFQNRSKLESFTPQPLGHQDPEDSFNEKDGKSTERNLLPINVRLTGFKPANLG